MKEIGLVTLMTENDDIVIDAYSDIDEAYYQCNKLYEETGEPFYYVQIVQLH